MAPEADCRDDNSFSVVGFYDSFVLVSFRPVINAGRLKNLIGDLLQMIERGD